MTERDLAGMVAVITGAGSGVGRAVAIAFAAAGGTPVLVGRTREPLWETAALVAGVGGQSLILPADVTDEAAVAEVFAQAADELEGIDAAILAAGVGRYGPVESYPLADWEETLATNLTGPFLCARAAIPHLRRNGGGAIVAVSSGAGKQGYPQLGAYSASKFGLMGLMQGLAGEVVDDGIKVCTVVPGSILTPFGGRSVAEKREDMASDPGGIPLSGRRRRGHPLPAAATSPRLDPGAKPLAILRARPRPLEAPLPPLVGRWTMVAGLRVFSRVGKRSGTRMRCRSCMSMVSQSRSLPGTDRSMSCIPLPDVRP